MQKEQADLYTTRIAGYITLQDSIRKQLSAISIFRILLFLVFAGCLYIAFTKRFSGYELLYAIATIPCFLLLLLAANRRKAKFKFLQQLVFINRNELDIAEGKPSFLDNGQLQTTEKSFTADLGIFGKDSLFHLINRTGSQAGKEQLTKRFSEPLLEPAHILNNQAAVKELAGKLEFRQKLLAHALLLEEKEALPQLRKGFPVDDFSVIEKTGWSIIAKAWPLAGVLLTVYSVWVDSYRYLLYFGILGLMILSFVFRKIAHLYNHISKRGYLYGQYAQCFQLIGAEKFQHPYLVQKQEEIKDAEKAFKDLSRIIGIFDLRMSLFSFALNGLFLLDLLCSRSYLQWSRRYQPQIPLWFDTLGEIELLNSLATFHYNHPAFIFPEPSADLLIIEATAMGHPLMRETAAVVNDIRIGKDSKLHIITGSNMSGKSTFLRTLGLNLLLAQTGSPVFADRFIFKPVQFLTSFHHIDSLSESTSYFYAELRALQSIIQSLEQGTPSLVLLDEVMRGTNSADKHDGTALLIKKILQYNCLTLIATHDTELGILANDYPSLVDNFCFESEITDKGLHFDFKKRPGVAQTKNATYLMQQMGIV